MGVVQRFEQRLGGLVEGAFARVFKGEVQPVELAGALKREADARKTIVDATRILTVNSFIISLGDHDFERLNEWAAPLTKELAAMVREHATDEHYSFVGPVEVSFEHDPALPTGAHRLISAMIASEEPAPLEAPRADTTRAVLQGRPRFECNGNTIDLSKRTSTIGRGPEAEIRIDDPGVSRSHAQVHASGGDIELVDAGSTNGTKLNGTEISNAWLRDGDRVTVGSTTITFRVDRG